MLAVYFIAFVWTRSHASWQDFFSAVLSITKDCFLKKILSLLIFALKSILSGADETYHFPSSRTSLWSRHATGRSVAWRDKTAARETKTNPTQFNRTPLSKHSIATGPPPWGCFVNRQSILPPPPNPRSSVSFILYTSYRIYRSHCIINKFIIKMYRGDIRFNYLYRLPKYSYYK